MDKSPYYAALDLGSNSFHLLIVQLTDNGIQEVDKIKHMVRLGEGLGSDNYLSELSIQRALEALREMGQRIAHIPSEQIRAVGTNTMRVAENGETFLALAEQALGADIEIISGTEEARLIYLGITEHNHFKDQILVIDVGGGSTEIIVGNGNHPQLLRSMKMGCANMATRFFPKGKITKNAVKKALAYVGKTVEPHISDISQYPWQRVVMSSGTAKAVEKVLLKLGLSESGIHKDALKKLLEILIDIGRADKLSEKLGIDEARAFGFTGGVCILAALSDNLKITRAVVSQQALREGVLLDLMGKNRGINDQRYETVFAMQQRFNIDKNQSDRVHELALYLFEAFPNITPSRFLPLLGFAADLHEIGLSIARSKQQNHGAYLMENAEMPGFSRLMQQMMAILLRGQRKKLPIKQISALSPAYQAFMWQFVFSLRFAILLYRLRIKLNQSDYPKVIVKNNKISLVFSTEFLQARPLTVSDLQEECQYWKDSPYQLIINLPTEEE